MAWIWRAVGSGRTTTAPSRVARSRALGLNPPFHKSSDGRLGVDSRDLTTAAALPKLSLQRDSFRSSWGGLLAFTSGGRER